MTHAAFSWGGAGVIVGTALFSTFATDVVAAQKPKPASASHSAQARAYFDDPFLTCAFGLLQTGFVKSSLDDNGLQLVASTQAQLDRFVRQEGGALLREEAARRFLNGSPAERQRAQLILARLEKVPADIVQQVSRSPRLQHRAWAAWCNTDGPQEDVASVQSLFRRGPTKAFANHNPLDDVTPALRKRLEIPADTLKGYKREYQAGYRKKFLPALERLREILPAKDWTRLDLDGDGIDELFVTGMIPDGWSGVGLTLILKHTRAAARWKIAYCRKWEDHDRGVGLEIGKPELCIGDFDLDGRPEVAESVAIVAGWCWQQIYYYDESSLSAPARFHGRGACVACLPNEARPVIVTRSAFNPTGGGKAGYLVTALATELRVTRWTGPKAETTTVLVRGNGW